MSLGWLAIVAGLLVGAFACYVLALIFNDRHEDRAAAAEFRASGHARTFRVELPYMAEGSYHRAAPRMIRSGPLYPADLPGPAQGDGMAQVRHQGNRAQFRAGETVVPLPDALPVLSGTTPAAADSGRFTPPPAPTTYQVRLAMATAINDAYLDRLFSPERLAAAA